MGDPESYITPDAVADFTTIRLEAEGEDRVRVFGVGGRPPTDFLKVSIAYADGYKAVGTLVYAWPDAVAKARAADRILRERLERLGLEFDEILTEYVGWNATHGPLAGEIRRRTCPRSPSAGACAPPTAPPWSASPRRSLRSCSPGPPSVTGFAGGRPRVQEVVAYWPALIPKREIEPHLRVDVRQA